jgi:uncharacterized membrane protein (Fun14 family)
LSVDDIVFAAGGGFLFGAVAGYAIKKVVKIAAIVVGLFIAALSYLSYKGFLDVKWVAMENATRSTLTSMAGQTVRALNNTAAQIATHQSAITATGLPVYAMIGFVPGLILGFKKG